LPGSNITIDRPKSRIVGPEQRSGLTWVSRRDPHGTSMFMQATNNAVAEETGCAKDGDDRCDHSVHRQALALDKGEPRPRSLEWI
jgi:hypothetical protein